MNKKRLIDFELTEIKEKVIADVKDIDSGNIDTRDGDVDDRGEGTGGVSCADADTRVARATYVDQRENINHIRAEDEFELVTEGNHNVHSGHRHLSYVLKRSRRLTTKSDVVTMSCRRRLIYDVLKTSDLRRV